MAQDVVTWVWHPHILNQGGLRNSPIGVACPSHVIIEPDSGFCRTVDGDKLFSTPCLASKVQGV